MSLIQLAFGTGVLAVGGLIFGVYRRHQKEREETQLLMKQTEELAILESDCKILLQEKVCLTREVASLRTVNAVLERKLASTKALEEEKDAKKVSVRDRVLEVEAKSLMNTSKAKTSKATRKCPPKVTQGGGMDIQTKFVEELKSRVTERLAKEGEAIENCKE